MYHRRATSKPYLVDTVTFQEHVVHSCSHILHASAGRKEVLYEDTMLSSSEMFPQRTKSNFRFDKYTMLYLKGCIFMDVSKLYAIRDVKKMGRDIKKDLSTKPIVKRHKVEKICESMQDHLSAMLSSSGKSCSARGL